MERVHADAPDVLLRVESLTKRFPQVLANDSVSFDVRKAEIHCLLGENGAGKSTLAECLYGFYRPDSGQVFFKGQPVTISSPVDAKQLGIGMVHQHFALVRPLTVVENVVVGTEDARPLLKLDAPQKKLKALCRSYGVEPRPQLPRAAPFDRRAAVGGDPEGALCRRRVADPR